MPRPFNDRAMRGNFSVPFTPPTESWWAAPEAQDWDTFRELAKRREPLMRGSKGEMWAQAVQSESVERQKARFRV